MKSAIFLHHVWCNNECLFSKHNVPLVLCLFKEGLGDGIVERESRIKVSCLLFMQTIWIHETDVVLKAKVKKIYFKTCELFCNFMP